MEELIKRSNALASALRLDTGLAEGSPAGTIEPVESTVPVYVQSNWTATDPSNKQQTVAGASDDGPGTQVAPLVSWLGVEKRIAALHAQGRSVVVFLGGGGTSGSTPWTAPTAVRDYRVRQVLLNPGYAYSGSVSIVGPEMVRAYSSDLTFSSAANVGTSGHHTRITFSGTPFTASAMRGHYARIKIIATGKKYFFEYPIAANANNNIELDCLNFGGIFNSSYTYEVVQPGARFLDSNSPQRGVLITAFGGLGNWQDFNTTIGNYNPRSHLERVSFVQPVFQHCRGLMLDRVAASGGARFDSCSVSRMHNFAVNGGALRWFGSTFNEHHGAPDENESSSPERVGYTSDPGPDGQTYDPQQQTRGINVQVTGAPFLCGIPSAPGCFRAGKGVSVRWVTGNQYEAALEVRGRGSHFYQGPVAYLQLENDYATGLGLVCADDASARVKVHATLTEITAAGGHLQVDNGAAINLGSGAGQYGEVAGFNGNFHRANTAAGGMSRIYWKTAKYGIIEGED